MTLRTAEGHQTPPNGEKLYEGHHYAEFQNLT